MKRENALILPKRIGPLDRVLDVGGWHSPLNRANAMIDIMPFETRNRAGAILTETTFSWPGIGKWLIESIARRDYPALQGGVMLVSSIVIGVNLLVDLAYGLINPRIRHA